jgi:hypothetical protein
VALHAFVIFNGIAASRQKKAEPHKDDKKTEQQAIHFIHGADSLQFNCILCLFNLLITQKIMTWNAANCRTPIPAHCSKNSIPVFTAYIPHLCSMLSSDIMQLSNADKPPEKYAQVSHIKGLVFL